MNNSEEDIFLSWVPGTVLQRITRDVTITIHANHIRCGEIAIDWSEGIDVSSPTIIKGWRPVSQDALDWVIIRTGDVSKALVNPYLEYVRNASRE